ncbi:hypothetical protein M3484_22230 [Pseudomonas sp. GX19020]|uniref:hypothetical protein n=1 Tax=Pseudomonas sp. GX19020 TaxID=2942277 RepID=UPI0020195AB4|nr:hypothetical protein [Pseudomonas sp. GX19020]MCL4069279.1 hypothetical protein [Pseudomonas sp. GX19020]
MKRIFHLKCSCGQSRHLAADDMPPQWLEAGGTVIRAEALAIMKCLHCGKRGAPALVEMLAPEVAPPVPVMTPAGYTGF